MLKQITLAGALLAVTSFAQAADNGVYLGAGFGQTHFDIDGATDDKDNGYKAILGLRLLDRFAVEANYADHGKARVGSGSTSAALEAKTAAAFAVGFLPLPVIDIFAKAGLAYTDASVRLSGISSSLANDHSTDFAWGAGVQAHFLSFAARVEYERFETDRKLSAISASVIYTFL